LCQHGIDEGVVDDSGGDDEDNIDDNDGNDDVSRSRKRQLITGNLIRRNPRNCKRSRVSSDEEEGE